jgi:hypothetical protein
VNFFETHEFLTSLQLASLLSLFSPAVIGLHAVAGYPVFPDVHVLAGVRGIPAVVGLRAFRCWLPCFFKRIRCECILALAGVASLP